MDAIEIVHAMLKRWWLVLLVPAVVLAGLVYRERTEPYQSTLRASVIIPGDTEIPGNAERPELMVMDDAPALVTSRAFAEAVAAQLKSGDVAGIQAALSASRYSRLLSITASSSDAGMAKAIATAAGEALPNAVNDYLVANPAKPAIVQVIDPASEPTRVRANAKLILLAETVAALVAGAFLAVIVELAARWRGTRAASSEPLAT